MAELKTPAPKRFDPIDPDEEFVAAPFRPRGAAWPTDVSKLTAGYDRDTDTLMIYFYGRDRPAVSQLVGDYLFVLTDPETDEVVGYQVEDFVSRAVQDRPETVDVLEFAELRDMSVEDVRKLRQDVLGYRGRFLLWLRNAWRSLPRGKQSAHAEAVAALIRDQSNSSPDFARFVASAC